MTGGEKSGVKPIVARAEFAVRASRVCQALPGWHNSTGSLCHINSTPYPHEHRSRRAAQPGHADDVDVLQQTTSAASHNSQTAAFDSKRNNYSNHEGRSWFGPKGDGKLDGRG